MERAFAQKDAHMQLEQLRTDGRQRDELRPIRITKDYVIYPEGSVLISFGNTRVLCNLTIQTGVPHWMQAAGKAGGWLTAEYALLPRSTQSRTARETSGLRGRTQEIRRLIGRSLRAALDLGKLGPRTCILDCDVLQADGGTRTAAITGAYIALRLGLQPLIDRGEIPPGVITSQVAAVSVGLVAGQTFLDLNYQEDSQAQVDMNVVMDSQGRFIEIQSTAESGAFTRAQHDRMIDFAREGISQLFTFQNQALSPGSTE